MSLNELSESDYGGRDRRSSVRARALLPCAIERIEKEDVLKIESHILDAAVLDSEYANLDSADWSERSDDLSREMVFVLNEIRALRQQLTDIRRSVQTQGRRLERRWVVINDKGFWIPLLPDDDEVQDEDIVRIEIEIPSLSSPHILALGEIIRVRADGPKPGMAIEFRSISSIHAKAILRYALRRERQLARSKLFSSLNL